MLHRLDLSNYSTHLFIFYLSASAVPQCISSTYSQCISSTGGIMGRGGTFILLYPHFSGILGASAAHIISAQARILGASPALFSVLRHVSSVHLQHYPRCSGTYPRESYVGKLCGGGVRILGDLVIPPTHLVLYEPVSCSMSLSLAFLACILIFDPVPAL